MMTSHYSTSESDSECVTVNPDVIFPFTAEQGHNPPA